MTQYKPQLTFFCELDAAPLQELFTGTKLTKQLKEMQAAISLGIIDLTKERAAVVKKLNKAGIPVTAWLLLPKDQGYWFNLENAEHAAERYQQFSAWTTENKLNFAGIGLDIEPDINLMKQLPKDPKNVLTKLGKKLFSNGKWKAQRQRYIDLVNQIRLDGYTVEDYQFPLIADERKARSNIMARTLGLVDLPVDREVFMLYTSFFPAAGAGILESYAGEAGGIGLGVTGGGVIIEGTVDAQPITWEALRRDMLLSVRHTPNLYIFSLEGCVWRDWLPAIAELDWNAEVSIPSQQAGQVKMVRRSAQAVLWGLSHPLWVLAGFVLIVGLANRGKKK